MSQLYSIIGFVAYAGPVFEITQKLVKYYKANKAVIEDVFVKKKDMKMLKALKCVIHFVSAGIVLSQLLFMVMQNGVNKVPWYNEAWI